MSRSTRHGVPVPIPVVRSSVAYFTSPEHELHYLFGVESRQVSVDGRHHRVTIFREGSEEGKVTIEGLARRAGCTTDEICSALRRFVDNGHVLVVEGQTVNSCRIFELHYNPDEVMDVPFGSEPANPGLVATLPVLKGFERERPSPEPAQLAVPASTPSAPLQRTVWVRWSVYLTPEEAALVLACRQWVKADSEQGRAVGRLLQEKPTLASKPVVSDQRMFCAIFGADNVERVRVNAAVAERCQFLAVGTIRWRGRTVARTHACRPMPADHWVAELRALAAMVRLPSEVGEETEREIAIKVQTAVRPEAEVVLTRDEKPVPPEAEVEEAEEAAPPTEVELVPLADFLRRLSSEELGRVLDQELDRIEDARSLIAKIEAELGRRAMLAVKREALAQKQAEAEELRRQAERAAAEAERLAAELAELA